jgi:hypothetical protein
MFTPNDNPFRAPGERSAQNDDRVLAAGLLNLSFFLVKGFCTLTSAESFNH